MKCFNHHDRDAFGVCKTCGKGLCLECMQKSAGFVHCKKDIICKLKAHSHCLITLFLIGVIIFLITTMVSPLQ